MAEIDTVNHPSENVTIYRDEWGVPHIHGKTDGDTAFGMGYAQAEDNFDQLERGFIMGIGRSAEYLGESALLADWVVHSFENNELSKRDYENATPPVKALLDGYAAGINYYIDTHPELEIKLLDHIEPWYSLALIRRWYYLGGFLGRLDFSTEERTAAFEAINGETLEMAQLEIPKYDPDDRKEFGSNAWAANGSKIDGTGSYLFINPHLPAFGIGQTYEAHMISDEGWNFSGYARFGYPLPYIGFNENLGWMSTDNYSNQEDSWTEHFDDPANPLNYTHGESTREAKEWTGEIKVKGSGVRKVKYRKTHHGSVVAMREGKFLSGMFATFDEPGWLDQWYNMQRANNIDEFTKAIEPQRMNFGNIIYADRDANIWYIYNGSVPVRNEGFDWDNAVDGSNPDTDWQGYHTLYDLPQVKNPVSDMMQNTNTSPFTVSMSQSDAKEENYPTYMVREGDNARSRNARRILNKHDKFDFATWEFESLDTTMVEWQKSKPEIMNAYASTSLINPERAAKLAPVIAMFDAWDGIATLESPEPTLYANWREDLYGTTSQETEVKTDEEIIATLEAAMDNLVDDWGTWQVAWGEANRSQRPTLASDGTPIFTDDEPSIATPGVPGWSGGSQTVFNKRKDGLKRRYKTGGNSYTAIVDFPRDQNVLTNSKSIHVFGASADPISPNNMDQAKLLANKQYKPAWLYLKDVKDNAVRSYQPGKE
ncbi:MAG: penicillin acylase family protein [Emcibacteraceae bacterium]|nr:penicillin acylase family protein [Emcibacteraceae bacterium]MDG1996557.1 penicillin acylase family protein [Emcibacteraceae bacterium]